LEVSLYHCKAAGGAPSGERVDDVYELAGQSIKSGRFQKRDELVRHLRRRTTPGVGRGHSPFLRGDLPGAVALLETYAPIDLVLVVYAVQPGLSAAALTDNVRAIVASANDSLSSQNVALYWQVSV
jgi:hypothetical protein